MRIGFAIILLALLVLAGACCGGESEPIERISPKHDAIQYLGAWHCFGKAIPYTIYPGSQIRFHLKGGASVILHSGLPGSVRIAVRRENDLIGTFHAGQDLIEIDGGPDGSLFSIAYLASSHKGFDPAWPESLGAELHFCGIDLGDGGELLPPPEFPSDWLIDFVGDSIASGVSIYGRSEEWVQDSDASRSFAFLLAERLGCRYRIRALQSQHIDEVAERFSYFRKGVPLPKDVIPDVVIVNIGANDRTKDERAYRAGMRHLLRAVFEAYPHARVVLLNFHRMTPDRWPAMQALALDYPKGEVLCFDARPYLVGYSDGGVHPDAESHNLLAGALHDFVLRAGLVGKPARDAGLSPLADGVNP